MHFSAYLVMFCTSFCSVFLLGIQSKNVNQSRYIAAIITSMGISIAQFVFVKYSASGDLTALAVMSVGGCMGIASSIFMHDTLAKRKKKK